jgi:hypothetical protein
MASNTSVKRIRYLATHGGKWASDSVEETDTQASPQQIMESSPLRAASDSVEETDTQASLPTNHGVLTTQGGK